MDLELMTVAATLIHQDCFTLAFGYRWDSITFVSSINNPGNSHPVAQIARMVYGVPVTGRFLLWPGPGFSDPDRTVRADRFSVPDKYRGRVEGKNVLVVDDTWVSGAKIQSAAVALHDAGAAHVTAFSIGRWCRYDWPSHKAVLDTQRTPYDAYVCPARYDECQYEARVR
ncbi:phosphoribosyltransferase [Saccharothrix sp. NPDC042600]|uniref:phosphoribosyltransferase n=1 Tax=Saccharothrix TaxID=2071 RepID=UPI0033FD52C7